MCAKIVARAYYYRNGDIRITINDCSRLSCSNAYLHTLLESSVGVSYAFKPFIMTARHASKKMVKSLELYRKSALFVKTITTRGHS